MDATCGWSDATCSRIKFEATRRGALLVVELIVVVVLVELVAVGSILTLLLRWLVLVALLLLI